jgi:uncharacterized phage protein (TIGR02220 family)
LSNIERVSFYITIPEYVVYDKRLTSLAKLIYGELYTIANVTGKGFTWISNGSLAERFSVSNKTISRSISLLNDCGYIEIKLIYKPNSKEIERRDIFMVTPTTQMSKGYPQKCPDPMDKKVKENNTNIINQYNKPKDIMSSSINYQFPKWLNDEFIEQVKKGNPENYEFRIPIAYLNQKLGKNLKFVEANLKPIKARFKDGYSLENFKTVIDKKYNDWIGRPDMVNYLRPSTLFGTKFDGYLNEIVAQKPFNASLYRNNDGAMDNLF